MSFSSRFTARFSRLDPGAGLTILFLGQTVATAVAAEMRGNNPSSEGMFLPKNGISYTIARRESHTVIVSTRVYRGPRA